MTKWLMSAGLLMISFAPATVASQAQTKSPGRASVRIQVVDSATGKPVTGARIHAYGWDGWPNTDADGVARMTVAPPTAEFRVRCPTTRRLAGRIVSHQRLRLSATTDTLVVVRIDAPSCVEPPETSVEVELAGHFVDGFEMSDFMPCAGLPAEATVYGQERGAAWATIPDSVRASGPPWPRNRRNQPYTSVYVRWVGVLTGPGAHGHLGGSAYKFSVKRILEVRKPAKNDCR